MNELASLKPETLEGLVTAATEAMLGLSFSLRDLPQEPATIDTSAPASHTVGVQIGSAASSLVLITADQLSGQRLGAAMFSCTADEVDAGMLKDALGELVNIIAGQVKVSLGLSSPLGLPHELRELPVECASPLWSRSAVLHTKQSEIRVRVIVTETPAQANGKEPS